MQKLTAQDPQTKSADLVAENLEHLKEVFPEAFVEGKVDFEVLKQILGAAVDEKQEKYGLNWHGKRKARQIALTPSTGTLRPCPEESVDWNATKNLMIEGDNLEVLKLLQKSYAGKVKLIYIDPPYNTGGDFIYPDNFQDNLGNYLEVTGQTNEQGQKLSSNTEASGRFHTNWLNMMYPRIKLAHSLLHRDGVMFITISDVELSRLRLICDEVFGEENFVANIVWQKKQSPQNDAINLSDMHDHIVVYARHARKSKSDAVGWLRQKIKRSGEQEARYENRDNDPRGEWTSADLTCNKTSDERPNLYFPVRNPITGEDVWPSKTRVWGYERPVMHEMLRDGRLWWGADGTNKPRLKIFREEVDNGVVPSTWWDREFAGDNQDAKRELRALFDGVEVFDTPKPTRLIRRIIEIALDKDASSIVLDFFAGSGTTAEAVLQANVADQGERRFIAVQLPEKLNLNSSGFKTIAEVTSGRIRKASQKLLAEAGLKFIDGGFRYFRLSSSNIQTWEPDRKNLAKTLEESVDHLKTDRTEQDILFELLLKLGLDLTVPIEEQKIGGHVVRSVGAGTLLTCLSTKIERSDAELLALGIVKWHKQLAPAGETQVVFRDSAFADDVVKSNLAAILQQHGLENVRSL